MPRRTEVKPILEEAVAQVMKSAMPRLQEEVVRLAAEQIESLLPASEPVSHDVLDSALASIQGATTQADILRQLLEGCTRFAARTAIFVVRSGSISGWQGSGFQEDDAIRNAALSASAGLVARAMNAQTMVSGATRDFDPGFISMVQAPAEDKCVVLPLVLKDKVAALVYADHGNGGALDSASLTALTRFTGLWLELSALRKEGAPVAEESAPAPVAAAATVAGSAASNSSATSYSALVPAAEEDGLHRKAKRFAKLLVEEIKLYNNAKVTAGRQNRDLYARLREDIEKSRATYDKRYADGPAASADYFTQELIRILADNDVDLMGSGFPR
ncbi:MAG TPA: hypothetical protein VHN74_02455 [Candidatus Angelobacter sp.]|jgi:hypothetical protein|nr:hypothetical protein [Candidatus Angelobacter sp.]